MNSTNCTTYVAKERQLNQQFQSRKKNTSIQICLCCALRIQRRVILDWSRVLTGKEGRGFLKEIMAKMNLEGHIGGRKRMMEGRGVAEVEVEGGEDQRG